MTGYCHDAYYTKLHSRVETDWESPEHAPSADWDIPLSWVAFWTCTLSAISLALGLTLKWLLQ
jgi:hypothetical protein